MPIKVSSCLVEAMQSEARRAFPRECCGILLGQGNLVDGILPARNIHPQPETHFEIDPQKLVDAHRSARRGGSQVLGYYHSHPNGLARPSATDARMAASDGAVWAIITAGRVTFWRAGDAGFAALPYETAAR
ncbi:MAG: peptidase [Citromicrobium sp.]|nr:MAG: peptidase [Citromicrobium sp.]